MCPKILLLIVAVFLSIVAPGCGGSSSINDALLRINLDEVAGNSLPARYRSPGPPCDHTLIPEESGGPGLRLTISLRCRQSELTRIMRELQSGLLRAAAEAGLPIVDESVARYVSLGVHRTQCSNIRTRGGMTAGACLLAGGASRSTHQEDPVAEVREVRVRVSLWPTANVPSVQTPVPLL